MQGSMQETRRSKVHNQWEVLLRAHPHKQRCRQRIYSISINQRIENWMDDNVEELGRKLAI